MTRPVRETGIHPIRRATAVAMTLCALLCGGPAPAQAAAADDEPLEIDVAVWVINIDRINSAEQTFLGSVFLSIEWQDPGLAHPGDAPELRPLDEVLYPGLLVANASGLVRRSLPDTVAVGPDGTATYRQRFVGTFAQPLDFSEFPFDQHTFSIHFVLPGFRTEDVSFEPMPRFVESGLEGAAGIAGNLSLPDWQILEHRSAIRPYQVIPGIASAGYAFEFTAARRSSYYVWKVILPLILIVMMSWAVFWIDPANSSSQISVSVTAMLTLIAYRFAVSVSVPPVPYMTRLDQFIMTGTVLVFLTLAEVIATSRLASCGRAGTAHRIDLTARILFPLAFVGFGILSLS